MNPIPLSWVTNRYLATPYPEGSYWENRAEKRLYYVLRHGILPDGTRLPNIRPLNIQRDYYTIMRRGKERSARARRLDSDKLKYYASKGDAFMQDQQTENRDYSPQVDATVYEARVTALHELADGLKRGEDLSSSCSNLDRFKF